VFGGMIEGEDEDGSSSDDTVGLDGQVMDWEEEEGTVLELLAV
jgi:hypothetical protein